MPTAAIGADVMTGFPGETDAEFESTRRLIADLPFTYLHVFTYSARPGTAAAALPAQVPIPIARDRNQILRGLAAEKKSAFLRSLVGKTLDAITLGATHRSREGDFTEALTDNYQKLYLPGNHQANRWVTARIRASQDELLFGDLQPAN
jgi:threonylcarbamoyladenosine tRNA methylthiotransferase MtaB